MLNVSVNFVIESMLFLGEQRVRPRDQELGGMMYILCSQPHMGIFKTQLFDNAQALGSWKSPLRS